jgi:hypothetical protein
MHRQTSGGLLSPKNQYHAYPAVRRRCGPMCCSGPLPKSAPPSHPPASTSCCLHRPPPAQARGALALVELVRRHLLLCLLGAVLVIGAGSWLSSGEDNPTRYVLVVDSGSTGTRMWVAGLHGLHLVCGPWRARSSHGSRAPCSLLPS